MSIKKYAQAAFNEATGPYKGAGHVVTVNWVNDERVDIEVDGTAVFTATHDEQGWDGMRAVIDLAKAMAGALGVEVLYVGTPNL